MAKRRPVARSDSYAPSRRINKARAMLDTPAGGVSIYDLSSRLGVSVRTAIRYIQGIEANEPLVSEMVDRKKVWRLAPTARRDPIRLTTSQRTSLFLSRRVCEFLAGTGFTEDIDEIFKMLEATLKQKDFASARHLDRKIYDVNESPYFYAGKDELVNQIVTALLKEERLRIRHESVARGEKAFNFEPYTLFVYKKGLYLAGHSHHHQSRRMLTLDGLREAKWLRGNRFDYPDDYFPSQLTNGVFGLIPGTRTRVRLFFTEKVARYVERRQWHVSQKFTRVTGGLEVAMEVDGTTEMMTWILGFGDQVEVLEPENLREAVVGELTRAAERYKRA